MLLGGAALTRTYVERDLREVYEGRLFYGKDAFEGLRVMDRLGEIKRAPAPTTPTGASCPASPRSSWPGASAGATPATDGDADVPDRSPEVAADNPVFVPPFLGSKVVKGIALDDIAGYINETALFRNQWQFRPEKKADGTKRPTTSSRTGCGRSCGPSWPRPRPRTCSSPRWSTATSPPTATATTWSSGPTSRATAS